MNWTARCCLALLCAVMTVPANAADDIVDTAVGAGSFGTLAAALEAGGLIDTLKGEGPFTVFAPTDEAFAKLPEGTVEDLLKPENKAKLVEILTYHVVPGKVMASDVVTLESANTVAGKPVSISVNEGTVSINDATVVQTDIEASNGVIHVIDSVLLPPSDAPAAAGSVIEPIAAAPVMGAPMVVGSGCVGCGESINYAMGGSVISGGVISGGDCCGTPVVTTSCCAPVVECAQPRRRIFGFFRRGCR